MKPFLAKKGHPPEVINRMYDAWWNWQAAMESKSWLPTAGWAKARVRQLVPPEDSLAAADLYFDEFADRFAGVDIFQQCIK